MLKLSFSKISNSKFCRTCDFAADRFRLRVGGAHSDIVVQCGTSRIPAHKAILSARSPVLARACADGSWKVRCLYICEALLTPEQEGKEGLLVLGSPTGDDDTDPSDDPMAIRMLLQFIYTADYLPDHDPHQFRTSQYRPQSATTDDRRQPRISGDSRRRRSSRDRRTFWEKSRGAPRDGQQYRDNAQSTANQDDPTRTENDQRPSLQGLLFKLHARMHSLGDKYAMPTLMRTAAEKFRKVTETLPWDDVAFTEAIAMAYAASPQRDNKLNGVIVDVLHKRMTYVGHTRMIGACIQTYPELAYGLYQQGRQSRGPSCGECGTVEIRECRSNSKSGQCHRQFVTCRCTSDKYVCDEHDQSARRRRTRNGSPVPSYGSMV